MYVPTYFYHTVLSGRTHTSTQMRILAYTYTHTHASLNLDDTHKIVSLDVRLIFTTETVSAIVS